MASSDISTKEKWTNNNNSNCNHFREAFTESCNELEDAIRSLDTLNKRIDAFRTSDVWILKQNNTNNNNCQNEPPKCATSLNRDCCNNHFKNQQRANSVTNHHKHPSQPTSTSASSLESSVTLIQTLLVDTQRQCTKMVDDNHMLANHLDGELGKCQEQVDSLRKELAYAHRCVNDLEVNMMINGSATESDTEGQTAEHEKAEIQIYRLREENSRLLVQLKATRREVAVLKMRRDEEENNQQQQQNRLASVVINNNVGDQNGNNLTYTKSRQQQKASVAALATAENGENSEENEEKDDKNMSKKKEQQRHDDDELKETLNNLQVELKQAKEALIVLKNDRKRLKSEKLELLNQMKEVYQTLESKERELRDFIRQFEQKMRDSDKGIKELIWEKEKAEKEKQKLEEALEKTDEKFNQMKIDLDREQNENAKLKAQLKELQGRFVLITGQSATTTATCTQIPTPSLGYASLSSASPASVEQNQNDSLQVRRRSDFESYEESSSKNDDNNQPATTSSSKVVGPLRRPRVGRKDSTSQDRNSNRLSRLFNLRRSKSKDEPSSVVRAADDDDDEDNLAAIDPITADLCLAEKADQLIQARKIPFARWRQSHILAWLELEMGMGQYSKSFLENVKSGRVLMTLSDNEIEHTLTVVNALHKKKLRLAIEEYRAPSLCKFPCIKEVTTHYVCSNFLPAVGLTQYVEAFRQNLVDGRILNYLNKKQLEKYLNVAKRFHQLSVLKGIELLRLFNYDVKMLNKRRVECDRDNSDLLVWTNARLTKWIQQVDLSEYADNLRDSGVHGALAVLDHTFTCDTFANALGIPTTKQMIRKHLADEFEPLQHQARTRLCNAQMAIRDNVSPRRSGSLNRNFVRSYTVNGDQSFDQLSKNGYNKKKNGLRGSIGRVFGLKVKRGSEEVVEISPLVVGDERTSIPIGESSPKTLNQSTGTISSATSDLGSSIERSQHMKTILGTPQVLIQPPMTSCLGPTVKKTSYSSDKLSDSSSDLSRLQHLCLSPGEGNCSGKGSSVRMRQKKSAQVRSPGANPTRPHSLGDFNQRQNSPKQHPQLLANFSAKSGALFSPQRLQNWLSLDHFDRNGSGNKVVQNGDPETAEDRHMGTIVEQGEFELETDIMEYKSVGGDEIVWHNSRKKEKSVVDSPSNKNRPRSLPLRSNSVDNGKMKAAQTSLDTVHETDL